MYFSLEAFVVRHHSSMSAVEIEWTVVSVKHPCTICAGYDGCCRGSDDEFACCTQVPSEWPLVAGGWVHRVSRDPRATPHAPVNPSARTRDNVPLAMGLVQ